MINFNGICRERSNGASPISQSQAEIKGFECLTMETSLMFQYRYTENIAMATTVTQFDRVDRELSNGTSPNFSSQIEVEME